MASAQTNAALVVINPVAGTSDPADLQAALAEQFGALGRPYRIYETSGAEDEDIPALVRESVQNGIELVIVAGGDGTISAVANGLVDSRAALGIVPIGTANVLAQELAIPSDPAEALALILAEPAVCMLDLLTIGERSFVLHIGVGVSSLMHRDTDRAAKRRYGRLAYLVQAWRWLIDFQPVRFTLVIDGKRMRHQAALVMVANGATLGNSMFRWSAEGRPDDGVAEVCVLYAKTLRDYLAVAWSTFSGRQRYERRLKIYPFRQSVSINTMRNVPVQADGELIGYPPILIGLRAAALRVIVPAA